MKTLVLLTVFLLSGCATTVAVVDTVGAAAVYTTKAVVGTTVDIVTYPFKDEEK